MVFSPAWRHGVEGSSTTSQFLKGGAPNPQLLTQSDPAPSADVVLLVLDLPFEHSLG